MIYNQSAWLVRYSSRIPFLVALAILLGVPTVTNATVTILGGNHGPFAPNSGSHIIEIRISADAGETIAAIDLGFDINGGVGPAPMITGIDLNGAVNATFGSPLPGGTTLFDNATHPSQLYPLAGFTPPGRKIFESVLFLDDAYFPIGENALLAKVQIDLTGVPVGNYPLTFFTDDYGVIPTIVFDGVNFPFAPALVDGMITVVPEPTTWVLGVLGFAGWLIMFRRKLATAM